MNLIKLHQYQGPTNDRIIVEIYINIDQIEKFTSVKYWDVICTRIHFISGAYEFVLETDVEIIKLFQKNNVLDKYIYNPKAYLLFENRELI